MLWFDVQYVYETVICVFVGFLFCILIIELLILDFRHVDVKTLFIHFWSNINKSLSTVHISPLSMNCIYDKYQIAVHIWRVYLRGQLRWSSFLCSKSIKKHYLLYCMPTDIQANIKLYSLGNRGIFSSLTSTIKWGDKNDKN